MKSALCALLCLLGACLLGGGEAAEPRRILFFTKSSGWEHDVISWKKGRPSFAERQWLEMAQGRRWAFTFSKDGSVFSPAYLAQFDAFVFYTTGDLTMAGTDRQPAMTPAGKQALLDAIRGGKGFVGIHSASDTFHTDNESQKGPERFANHGERADPYVRCLGGEFIVHGAQQLASNRVVDPAFPGLADLGPSFSLLEEWYSLKDFRDDLRVLTVIDAPAMKGDMYRRPPYPTTWARAEGKGRVWYTALGHREDVWTNPVFRSMLIGGVEFALGDAKADLTPNLKLAAPEALTNPAYVAPKPARQETRAK